MKKGFTLIELLAVIVILAIIALIAFPTISDIVEKSRKGGAESSALGWIDAVEKQSMVNELSSSNTIDLNSSYNVSELISKGVKVKGQKPSSGYVTLTNGKVSSSTLCIGNYKVVIENNKVKSSTKENNCTVDSAYPSVVYSQAVGVTRIGYPIDAGIDMGVKYYFSVNDKPHYMAEFDSEKECNDALEELAKSSPKISVTCVSQNFITPNLDYKTSPDADWVYYLRHTLNSNGIIEDIDVCGKYNGEEFCLERNTDDSKYKKNKDLLLNTFGSDKCDQLNLYSSIENGDMIPNIICEDSSISFASAIQGHEIEVGEVDSEKNMFLCKVYSEGNALCVKESLSNVVPGLNGN